MIYIVDEFDPDELKGLSVDVAHNMVYWTQGSTLKWLHIQEYEDNGNVRKERGMGGGGGGGGGGM